MSFELMRLPYSLIQKQAVFEIEQCNAYTFRFGLTLSHEDATELDQTRSLALKSNGRIEFGGGAVGKIIKEFCDSPYLSMSNYAFTLHELTELFYYYKNETLDLIGDDDLIRFMKKSFDGTCQGSLELLAGRELADLAHSLRFGTAQAEEVPQDEDEEDEND